MLVGFCVFAYFVATAPDIPPPREEVERPQIRVFRAQTVPVRRETVGFGTARAKFTAEVSSEVAGQVAWIAPDLEPGTRVKAHDPLIRLNDEDFRQQLDLVNQRLAEMDALISRLFIEETALSERSGIANREFEIAARDLARIESLFASGAAREPEVDRARMVMEGADRARSLIREELAKIPTRKQQLEAQQRGLSAERTLAQRNTARTTISAPFDGVVTAKNITLGEQIAPGRNVAKLVDLSIIEVPIKLPASVRPRIRRGDSVELHPAGDRQRRWTGVVDRIAAVDDAATRTFEIYVEIRQRDDDSALLLTPGLYVEGRILASEDVFAMIVPRRALDGERLIVVEDGRVVRREVTVAFFINSRYPQLGLADEDYWAVLAEPLPEGTLTAVNASTDIPIGSMVEAVVMNGDDSPGNSGATTEREERPR